MSESLERVRTALKDAGLKTEIFEMPSETRTAEQAAAAAGCSVDQIAKSMVFACKSTGDFVLFITGGGNRVDPEKAARLVGEDLERADADEVRQVTGFAIGGVAPVGHLAPIRTWMDAHLLLYPQVWAAAGTPRHIFPVSPFDLARITSAPIVDFTA